MDDVSQHDRVEAIAAALQEDREKGGHARTAMLTQLNTLRAAVEELSGQLEAEQINADSRMSHAQEKVASFKLWLAEHTQQNTVSAERLTTLEEEVAALKEAREEWNAQRLSLEKDLADQEAAAQAAQKRIETLEAEGRSAQEADGQAQEALAALEQECAEQKEKAASLSQDLESATQALAEKTTALEEAEKQRQALESQLADKEGNAQASLSEAQTAAEKLRTELDMLRAERDTAAQKAAQLEADLQDRSEAAAQLEDKLSQQEAQAAELRTALEAAPDPAALETLQQEVATLKENLAEEQRALEEERARSRKSILAQQLAEALEEAETAQEEVRRLKALLGAASPTATGEELFDAVPESAAPPSPEAASKDQQRIRALLKQNGDAKKKTMGELLVAAKIITKDQLAEALEVQKQQPNTHLGAILIDRDWASEEAVAEALALSVRRPLRTSTRGVGKP